MNRSGLGTLQIPTEFCDFLMDCCGLGIESAVEVGVFRGGSSYFAAAMLQRANPSCIYTLVDIADYRLGYREFAAILNLQAQIPGTAAALSGWKFDFVFIDGDHSYDGARVDYIHLGQHAKKVLAFHDIHAHEFNGLDGGVRRMWREARDELHAGQRSKEYAHYPDRWMGIGAIFLEQAPDGAMARADGLFLR
jgi:hypothetical protein